MSVAGHTFEVMHCPGHSPGSVVLVNRAQRFALMGDVLFQGSVERTDLPMGSHEALMNSIRTKVMTLARVRLHLRARADKHHRPRAAHQSVHRRRRGLVYAWNVVIPEAGASCRRRLSGTQRKGVEDTQDASGCTSTGSRFGARSCSLGRDDRIRDA